MSMVKFTLTFSTQGKKFSKSTDIDLCIQYIFVSGIFLILNFVTVLKYERYEFLDSFIHFLVSLTCSFSAYFIVPGTNLGAQNAKCTKFLAPSSLLPGRQQSKYMSKYIMLEAAKGKQLQHQKGTRSAGGDVTTNSSSEKA